MWLVELHVRLVSPHWVLKASCFIRKHLLVSFVCFFLLLFRDIFLCSLWDDTGHSETDLGCPVCSPSGCHFFFFFFFSDTKARLIASDTLVWACVHVYVTNRGQKTGLVSSGSKPEQIDRNKVLLDSKWTVCQLCKGKHQMCFLFFPKTVFKKVFNFFVLVKIWKRYFYDFKKSDFFFFQS